MIIIENQALNRCANYGDSFAAVSNYLKDWFVASDASETWGKVFSVVNVCNLEDQSWVGHLFSFQGILFLFLSVPEPFVQLFFVKTGFIY